MFGEKFIRYTGVLFAASIVENVTRNIYYSYKYECTAEDTDKIALATLQGVAFGARNVLLSPILVPAYIHRAVTLRQRHWNMEEIFDPDYRRALRQSSKRIWNSNKKQYANNCFKPSINILSNNNKQVEGNKE